MSHRSLKTPAPHSVLGTETTKPAVTKIVEDQSAAKVTHRHSPGCAAATS